MDVIDHLYALTEKLPSDELYGLRSQIRKAAVAVAANLAEGHGRRHLGDYLYKVSVSRGEVMELDTLVEVCRRRHFITDQEAAAAVEMLDRESRMLSGLRTSLEKQRI